MSASRAPDLLFYDGYCGLCHRLVAFLVRRDPHCRFAPLGGSTYQDRVGPSPAQAESLVVLHGDRVLVRSDAVLHLLRGLGGGWALLAGVGRLVPVWLRDAAYALVARLRLRLFRRPEGMCPVLPLALRARFLP